MQACKPTKDLLVLWCSPYLPTPPPPHTHPLSSLNHTNPARYFSCSERCSKRERERVDFGSDSLPRNTRQEQTLDECLGSYLWRPKRTTVNREESREGCRSTSRQARQQAQLQKDGDGATATILRVTSACDDTARDTSKGKETSSFHCDES
ncbi:hypothetical protein C4D60_Mb10t16840 [Musa balbisiana]|uniref:Uncharacterized protein n=1 Tax=Musa balbisiana TaxID=52838 RepID=A0A4S8IXR5_MUSBA|nr:hypothetical protein C4D60_Mb10t16840 [Musa balbisiana]